MGRVYRTLKIIGVKESAEVEALFDTGASRTFMSEDIASQEQRYQKLKASLYGRCHVRTVHLLSTALKGLLERFIHPIVR